MSGSLPGIACFLLLLGGGWLYQRGCTGPLAARLALAHLIGAAAVATGITCGVALTGRVHFSAGFAGLAAVSGLGLIRGAARKRAQDSRPVSAALPSLTRLDCFLLTLLAVGLVTALARAILLPLDWDAWAFWQLKARAMSHGSLRRLLQDWRYLYGHPDYPLLNPSQTWWLCAGSFNPKMAQLNGLLFMVDLLVLFYDEALARMSRTWALVGCVAIVSWPPVMKHAVSGFSDLLLSVFIFAAIVQAARGNTWRMAPCLAGALLTKNEGILALLPVALTASLPGLWLPAAAADTGVRKGFRFCWGALAIAGGVAAITAGAWHLVARRWGLYSLMLDPDHWTRSFLALLPERVWVDVTGFGREAVSVGPWYPGWGLLWPLAGIGIAITLWKRLLEAVPFWLVVAAHALGIAAAFLLTAVNAEGYLLTSLDRLALQIAPTALMATMVAFYRCGAPPVDWPAETAVAAG